MRRYIGGVAPVNSTGNDQDAYRIIQQGVRQIAEELEGLYDMYSREPTNLALMRRILSVTESLYIAITALNPPATTLNALERDYDNMINALESEQRRQFGANLQGQGFGKIYKINKQPEVFR